MGLTATVADLLITSPANPRLKAVVALRRRRTREDSAPPSSRVTRARALALASGIRPQTLFVCAELFSPAGQAGRQDIGHQRTWSSTAATRRRGRAAQPAAFEKVAYREGPDGLLGVVPAVGRAVDDSRRRTTPCSSCQRVEKPGNLGAMLRTADAAGVDAVVAADPVTDWGNPNVVRASKGTVFAVPVATATTTETLQWLAAQNVRSGRTTPETDLLHTDVDLTGRGGRRGREPRSTAPTDDLARRGHIPGPNPHARQGELAERRGVGRHRSLRGAPAAPGRRGIPPGCGTASATRGGQEHPWACATMTACEWTTSPMPRSTTA